MVIWPFAIIIKGSGGFLVPRTKADGSSTVAGESMLAALLLKFEGDTGEWPSSPPSFIKKYRAEERFAFC